MIEKLPKMLGLSLLVRSVEFFLFLILTESWKRILSLCLLPYIKGEVIDFQDSFLVVPVVLVVEDWEYRRVYKWKQAEPQPAAPKAGEGCGSQTARTTSLPLWVIFTRGSNMACRQQPWWVGPACGLPGLLRLFSVVLIPSWYTGVACARNLGPVR